MMDEEHFIVGRSSLEEARRRRPRRCKTHKQTETRGRRRGRTNQHFIIAMMKEQQRARHCALGLNAYTHTEIRDTRPIIFEREREQSSRPIHISFTTARKGTPPFDWISGTPSFVSSFSYYYSFLLLLPLYLFLSSFFLLLFLTCLDRHVSFFWSSLSSWRSQRRVAGETTPIIFRFYLLDGRSVLLTIGQKRGRG
jgi:hypothetical protein